jgi:hypothetical protein
VRDGEVGEGGDVLSVVAEHGFDFGELPAEHAGDDVELAADAGRVGLGEDGADRGGDHVAVPGGDGVENVAAEVDAAALPGGAEQDRTDRGLQPSVRIGDHQHHPVQPAGLEPAQETGPERAGFAVADVEAEDLPAPVRGHAGGDDDRLRGYPAAPAAPVATDPGLAKRRVQEHSRNT